MTGRQSHIDSRNGKQSVGFVEAVTLLLEHLGHAWVGRIAMEKEVGDEEVVACAKVDVSQSDR